LHQVDKTQPIQQGSLIEASTQCGRISAVASSPWSAHERSQGIEGVEIVDRMQNADMDL
jgi:hypothetical protein